MIGDEHIEIIRTYLPHYLSKESQDELIKDIKNDFPESRDPYKIYSRLEDRGIIYQGDGLIDIPFSVLNVSKGHFDLTYQKGITLSNTCDISSGHIKNRIDKINIQFAGVFSLQDYIKKLKDKKIEDARINSFQNALKRNHITNLFYLPERKYNGKVILPESFIKFDHSVTLPVNIFYSDKYSLKYNEENGDKLFSLSNYGFYLFLLKLSVHYSRIREGVFRNT